MKSKAVVLWVAGLALVGWAAIATAGEPASQPVSIDWPQWRGPTRDGIAPSSPKLLDQWPTSGPDLLWKSDFIPAQSTGGSGSVVVSGGRAFVYVNHLTGRLPGGKVGLTTKDLQTLGWMEGVPDDLAAKIEEARRSPKRPQPGPAMAAYVKEFAATLDPALAEKFGRHIQDRLTAGPRAMPWDKLVKLASIRDKEYPPFDETYIPNKNNFGEHPFFAEAKRIDAEFQPGRPSYPPIASALFKFTDVVICLDAATGKEIWRNQFEATHPSGDWPGSSTPAIADGRCYVQAWADLYCLSARDGEVEWQAKTRYSNASPLVANGVVYITEPDLIAYNAESGRLLWKTPIGGSGYGGAKFSVVLWTSGGKSYLIGLCDGLLYCVEPDTGKMLWKVAGVGAGEGSSSVAISGDTAAFYGNGGVYAFKLTPQKAEQLWKTPPGTWRADSLIIYRDHVYVGGTSPMRCMDLKTGEVKWAKKEIGNMYSSPILADGKLLYPFGHGWFPLFMVMFNATPEKYEELGRFPKPQNGVGIVATCSSPAIANGKLYLRLDNCVACYDVAEHRPYVGEVAAKGNELVCAIKQADGGLTAEGQGGAIQGLVVTDALGAAKPAKARLEGNTLAVDIKDTVFPVDVSYESGNLSAKNGPLAPFHWQSPRLLFKRCDGNTVTLDFRGESGPDPKAWNNEKVYEVAGAKVTGVDVSRWAIRLTTDKEWKMLDKIVLRYPAMPGESSIRKVELSGIVPLAHPVGDKPLQEFLFGEKRAGVEAKEIEKTLLAEDNQDKNIKPEAGDKWKIYRILPEEEQFNLCQYFGSSVSKTFIPACVYVYADKECKVQLWYRDNGGMQIVVNGKVVSTDGNEHSDYNKIKDIALNKGWNTVLLTLGVTKDWVAYFSLRLCDEQGHVPSGLWYTAERPVEK